MLLLRFWFSLEPTRCHQELVEEDQLVYVDGRLNLREETPKIIAEDIMPLNKVQEMHTKAVVVKMSTTGLEEQVMLRIKKIIAKHKGDIPVYVDLITPEGRKVRLSTDKELSVLPSDNLVVEMEQLTGAGNIRFITK